MTTSPPPALHGKRLLILGGNPETGALVRAANALGVVTIVADPNPHAPAKREAHERHEVDCLDVSAVVSFARGARVDGVLVGVADLLVRPYQRVCERLGLPSFATPVTAEAFGTKAGFRDACARYGIPGIPGYPLDHTLRASDVDALRFPVMLKPVDGSAGVGMTVCRSVEELPAAVRSVRSHSRSGAFLTERYMTCADSFAYYTFHDGEVYLSAMADRHTTRRQGDVSPVCIGATYPSRHLDTFVRDVHPGLLAMFRGLGVRNGVLMVQFFVDEGAFYAYDPGFRLQGEAPHVVLDAINGFNHQAMLVSLALTGTMGVPDLAHRNDPALRGKCACTVWVLLRAGTIGAVRGLDAIRAWPGVVFVLQRFAEGDRVPEAAVGTERQVFARIYLVAQDGAQLRALVAQVHATLGIEDAEGDDMIVDRLPPDVLSLTGTHHPLGSPPVTTPDA
jgi:biotin carboxylase